MLGIYTLFVICKYCFKGTEKYFALQWLYNVYHLFKFYKYCLLYQSRLLLTYIW